MKIVVVGGVAAGASAAAKARRQDETAEIIMFEKGDYVSYANCGIPYYLGGDINSRESLFLVTPERFRQRFNIEVRVKNEVTKINHVEKWIEGINLADGTSFRVNYDKLVLAMGGEPIVPPIPGMHLRNVSTLWTVPDVDVIKGFVEGRQLGTRNLPLQAVVVGGGFVGLEAVEALLNIGAEVTLVERLDQVMPPLDHEMAALLSDHLRGKGVKVILGNGVAKFLGDDVIQEVELADGNRLPADLVIMAVGVKPRLALAKEAGLEIGPAGGVVVNARMETSVPDIYAAGDIVESLHLVSGKKMRLPLAGPANKQGRVAGANAAGGNKSFKGVLGTMIVKLCDLVAAKTGISETEAKGLGINYFVSYTHSGDHAGYYPGAEEMAIKLVVQQDKGLLLGAQIVGGHGVDKRIDVLASAIYNQMTVEDLEDLDLAYAPPFSSAKDPVIVAGMVAANIWRGEVQSTTPHVLAEKLQQPALQLVDVRTPAEFKAKHIPGAINVPIDVLRQRYQELDPGKETILYCGVAYRSYLAYRILFSHGFENMFNLSGGFKAWLLYEKELADKIGVE